MAAPAKEGAKGQSDVFEYDPDDPANQSKVDISASREKPGGGGGRGGAPDEDLDDSSVTAKKGYKNFAKQKQKKEEQEEEIGHYVRRLGKAQPEYEFVGQSARPKIQNFETPEQRLLRLQVEVADFLKVLHSQATAAKSGSADDCLLENHEVITSELHLLEQKLESLANDDSTRQLMTSKELSAVSHAGQRSVLQSLVGQLERMSEHLKDGMDVDDKVTYQLHYTPDMKPLVDASKISAVEAKVAEIEKRLGIPGVVCPFADVQSGILHLQQRLALLDGTKIEAINRRVHAVMGDLDAVLQRKAEFINQDADKKASELFEMCHRWNAAASALPAVVMRLQSLKGLHQHSGSFASRLTVLEQQQEELAKLLSTTNAAVHNLQKSMQENMLIMKDNLLQLEQRMEKIK